MAAQHYYVYVLQNQAGRTYTGQTNNIARRLLTHNSPDAGYTKSGQPWHIIYIEECATRALAMAREKELKTGKGRDFIKSLTK